VLCTKLAVEAGRRLFPVVVAVPNKSPLVDETAAPKVPVQEAPDGQQAMSLFASVVHDAVEEQHAVGTP
jgi:hypothetical protein